MMAYKDNAPGRNAPLLLAAALLHHKAFKSIIAACRAPTAQDVASYAALDA